MPTGSSPRRKMKTGVSVSLWTSPLFRSLGFQLQSRTSWVPACLNVACRICPDWSTCSPCPMAGATCSCDFLLRHQSCLGCFRSQDPGGHQPSPPSSHEKASRQSGCSELSCAQPLTQEQTGWQTSTKYQPTAATGHSAAQRCLPFCLRSWIWICSGIVARLALPSQHFFSSADSGSLAACRR